MKHQKYPVKEITKPFIAQFLPSNPIIIEAGGHIGRDAKKLARMWPEGSVHSFEPVRNLFDVLVKNTALIPNVSCYNYALSSQNSEQVPMHVSSGRSTALSSLLEPTPGAALNPETSFSSTCVTTITLDEWAKQHHIGHIDFIWLDVQGYELEALKGAKKLLPSVKALFIEVNLTERYKGAPLYDEVTTWIESHGFTGIAQDAEKHQKVNVLFVRN